MHTNPRCSEHAAGTTAADVTSDYYVACWVPQKSKTIRSIVKSISCCYLKSRQQIHMHISYLMLCKTAIFSCLSWGSRMVLQVLASWLSAEQLYTWTHLSWWAVRAVRELSAASSLCAKYSILTVLHYESISSVSRPLHRPQYCSTIAATVYLYDGFILLKVESEVDMGILKCWRRNSNSLHYFWGNNANLFFSITE